MSFEPGWASSTASNSSVASQPPSTPADTPAAKTSNRTEGPAKSQSFLLKSLSILNILIVVAMVALGLLALIHVKFSFASIDQIIISIYMVLFGVLLFLYEFLWWTTIESINRIIRKNFGFMYGVRGKGFYIIFVACLCIGLERGTLANFEWLRYLTGIAWLAVGVLHEFLSFMRTETVADYKPPTAGWEDVNSPV